MIYDELRKAQKERKALSKKYDSFISAETEEKEKDRLIGEFLLFRGMLDAQISSIQTIRIQNKAEEYGIPTPSPSDQESWEQGYNSQGYLIVFLNAKARLELLNNIRKERRTRWEDKTIWIDRIVMPVIALLGVLTGAILKD